MSTALSIVSDNTKVATVAERVRRLQAEARQLAQDHVLALSTAMAQANHLAQEIDEGGEAYPPGIRDLARRFAEDCDLRLQSIEAIAARV